MIHEPDPVLEAMRERIANRMENPPPKPTGPANLRLAEGNESQRPIQSIKGGTVCLILAALCFLYGSIFGFVGFRAARDAQAETAQAREGMQRAMEGQAVYLDRTEAAEKRTVKAETRAEYLEELLKKHLNITPNLESMR